MNTLPFAHEFLAGCGAGFGQNWEVSAALNERLAALYENGRAAWPMILLTPECFARHLGRHAVVDEEGAADPLAALDDVLAADLYLACACAQSQEAALQAFEQEYVCRVPAYVAPVDSSPSFADEVMQVVRTRLLCAHEDGPPRIGEYAGRGSLAGWLRVVSVRVAHNLRRGLAGHLGSVDPIPIFEQRASPEEGADLLLMRARYGSWLKEAIQEAIMHLDAEQRNLLSLSVCDGRTTVEIGKVLRVDHSTVSRRLQRVRSHLFAETRRILQERFGVPPSELSSLVGLVRSHVDFSIARILKGA